MLNGQLSDPVVKRHDLVIHRALVVVDLALLLFKYFSHLLFPGLQVLVR